VVKGVKKHLDSGAVNIIDAPPGTSCPVVEAVNGVDVAVLVTEPTLFGLNDLKLAVGLVLEMRVPLGIIVNRSDGTDKLIQDYADSVRVPVVGRIPFSRDYAETYSSGDILATKFPELKENLLNIYENIKQVADLPVPEKVELEELKSSGDAKPFEPEMIGDADDYCELTVISGKGGTGKTTVTASLAVLSENKVLADCDVDAADLHLLLKPEIYEQKDFSGGKIATIDHLKCFGCGKCADACRFKAIELGGPGNDLIAQTYKIDELSCEGCGLCLQVCPASAISDHDKINGKFYVSGTVQGPMVHARLGLAEDNSGKLVSKVRGRATGIAEKGRARWILADGPPGTGCPVIASVAGTDLVLAVTEPTVSGVHDLERVLELVKHFGVKAMVVINKCDLNREMAALIKEKSASIGAEVIAEIPFDSNVNKALAAGKTVVDYGEGPAAEVMNKIWNIIKEKLG
jgi:MinD superfamily P-loop ATPase